MLSPIEKLAAKVVPVLVKTFVLDTNVLIHEPESIFRFAENDVVIPVEVLEELDAIKTEQSTERGRSARRVHRILQELLPDSASMSKGVPLPNGGTLRVVINGFLDDSPKSRRASKRLRAVLSDFEKKDNRIIACAFFISQTTPPPVILVTKDVNVQLKARAVGLESEDYRNDKAPETDNEGSYRVIPVSVYELQRFCSDNGISLDAEIGAPVLLNEYVLLRSDEGKTMPARYYGKNEFRCLRIPQFVKAPGGVPIRPRNLEQQFFMDALLDDSISLVTCFGKAGTGKTLLSTACALHQTTREDATFDGVSITRPVITLGKDIGFLPGTLDEKMKPWLQPYFDALEIILPSKAPADPRFENKPVGKKNRGNGGATGGGNEQAGHSHGSAGPMKPYERLIRSGVLEVEALCFIRGRSIARRFFILDEAQQLTPHEVKTVITRISEGSKIVLIGDPSQIDNPYVDARSNGLVYCQTKMKGQAVAAHVSLTKGERSKLAELGSQLL